MTNFSGLRPALLNWLEKKAVKAVLKKLAIAGGIKGWLIAFVVGELIEEVDEHLIEPAFRKIGYRLEVYKGKKLYKRIEDADDIDDWRDTVSDA